MISPQSWGRGQLSETSLQISHPLASSLLDPRSCLSVCWHHSRKCKFQPDIRKTELRLRFSPQGGREIAFSWQVPSLLFSQRKLEQCEKSREGTLNENIKSEGEHTILENQLSEYEFLCFLQLLWNWWGGGVWVLLPPSPDLFEGGHVFEKDSQVFYLWTYGGNWQMSKPPPYTPFWEILSEVSHCANDNFTYSIKETLVLRTTRLYLLAFLFGKYIPGLIANPSVQSWGILWNFLDPQVVASSLFR